MRHAMESKRKSNGGVGGGAEDLDDRSTKRRKTVIETDLSNGETVDTTREYGLAFLEQIKTTKDKSGRAIATAFLSLPDKKALPDYYQITKLPIALDTIEVKLKKGDFPTLSALESYFKRMVQNAKEYNERGSQISDDAERIRKALSNYMTKHNPAYKTPGYVSQPTPIPNSASASASEVEAEEEEPEPEAPRTSKKPRGRPPKNPQAFARAQSQRSSATPAVSETKYAGVSYSTLSFQQAQEKLVSDMINYKEDPEDEGAYWEVFVDLPPRSLKVYYQMIPNPMSLRKLQMRVTGNHGRNGSTGVSDYKTWAALEEDMSLIWNNAKHFNEDGSPIFNLALEFEPFFYKALREAKQAVPDPVAPKIKIKLPTAAEPTPSLKIKLGAKASPADSPAPQSNGTNGTPTIAARRNPFGNSSNAALPPNLEQLDRARSMSGSAASPTPSAAAVVKKEDGARASPAIPLSAGPAQSVFRAPSQPVSTPTPNAPGMPPPSTTTPGLQSTISSGGYAQSFNHQSQYQPQNPVFDLKWRQPGKGAGDAMITNLSLATHPGLNISRHFRMDLPPSPTMAQQSITINLPSTHYYLQIKPTIAPALLERQYKLFVTSGTQRLHAMPTIPGHSVDQRHPLFEARLLPGVNRIEVELIAALPKGAPKLNGQDAELEKITVYANLMR